MEAIDDFARHRSHPKVSLVVSTFGSARYGDTIDLLLSVKRQNYNLIETFVIVERDKSTGERLRAFASANGIPNANIIDYDGFPGLSATRTFGAKMASGDVVAFVDDDNVLFDDWASELALSYDDPDVIGVSGPIYPEWLDSSMKWFPEELYWMLGCSSWQHRLDHTSEVRHAAGGNMSFRSSVFERCGYFVETVGNWNGGNGGWFVMSAEDIDFSLRARKLTGGKIVENPMVRCMGKVHPWRFSLVHISKRAFRFGLGRARLMKVYGKDKELFDMSLEKNHLLSVLRNSGRRGSVFGWRTAARRRLVLAIAISMFAAGYAAFFLLPGTPDITRLPSSSARKTST